MFDRPSWRPTRSGRAVASFVFPVLTVLVVLAAVAVDGLVAGARAERLVYGCVLSGMQEPAPNGSPALGGGSFIIDTVAQTMTYRVVFTGLTAAETAAHIHGPADPGVNGGIKHTLPAGSPKTGVWSYAPADEGDILAGKMYVNIHSGNFGGGEIRGQIVPLNAVIDGAQEPNASPGKGWAIFSIDTAANMLGYHIEFGGLMGVETAAHIHGTALHLQPGGVLQALPAGNPKVGVWNYPEALEVAIISGQTYVNIHSTMFPGGEIRGQIVPVVVPLDGRQEVGPVNTPAAGIALMAIDTEANVLTYDLRFANLQGAQSAAHIHGFAPTGINAGVLHPLNVGSPEIGRWDYGFVDEPQVLAGLTYFNVHSVAHPGGEIRGQIENLFLGTLVGVSEPTAAGDLLLARSFPNPAGPRATIEFSLEHESSVRLVVYDIAGRRVRELLDGATMGAGSHPVAWDGRDATGVPVANGVYHYVIETPGRTVTGRLALVR